MNYYEVSPVLRIRKKKGYAVSSDASIIRKYVSRMSPYEYYISSYNDLSVTALIGTNFPVSHLLFIYHNVYLWSYNSPGF
jgi:hypothetical protein